MMRKSLALMVVLIMTMVMLLAGAALAADPVVLKVAHVFKPDFSASKGVADFAALVAKKTNGSVKVNIYPNAQLGNERECLEGAKLGTHDIALTGAAGWAILNPKLGTFELPFLYRDMDHQQKVFTSGMAATVDKMFGQAGLKFLCYYGYGIRSTLTTDKPIKTLADFKGVRLRVPEVPIFVKTFKALGANPTPINYGEVYTALQADVVKGVEGSPESMVSMKFTELCKYYSLTKHQSPPILMAINKDSFNDKLSAEQQKQVLEAAAESARNEFNQVVEANKKALEYMKANNVEVIELPAAEVKKIEAAVQTVYEELGKKYGGLDLIAKIKSVK
jgi:tripartite ATP-independent transporter DctP family solute receptor